MVATALDGRDNEVIAALETHRNFVMDETLAVQWGLSETDALYRTDHTLGDERWAIRLARYT